MNYFSMWKRLVVGDCFMDFFFNDIGGSFLDEDFCVNVCGVLDDDLFFVVIFKKWKGMMKFNSSIEEYLFLGELVLMRERYIEIL